MRHALLLAPQKWQEVDAVNRLRWLDPGRGCHRGEDVHAVDHRRKPSVGRHHVRPAYGHRHSDAPFENVELLPPMRAVGCAEHRRFAAIVAQKDNERAFVEPRLVDRVEHTANRSIEPAHDGCCHPPLAVEVGEAIEIHLQGCLLQMCRHEGNVQKEWLRGMVADERRGLLGDEIVNPALVHRPFDARDQWRVDVFSRRPDPAAELVKPACERTVLALPEMPLADQGGPVAVIAEHLG